MHSPEEVQAQEFIDTLEFGDVFHYSDWQLVFLHRDGIGTPDCLLVKGDVNKGNFTLDTVGTINPVLAIREVIAKLSLEEIEQHFKPWNPRAKDDCWAIIRSWA